MESIARSLRSSVDDDGRAPYAVILDDAVAIGGNIFIQKILERIIQAIPSEHAIVLVTLAQPPSSYTHLFRNPFFTNHCIIDCFTDPYAWKKHSKSIQKNTCPLFSSSHTDDARHLYDLSMLTQSILSLHPENTKICLVLDSLSPLLDHFNPKVTASFVGSLRRHPRIASMTSLIHNDLHSQSDIALNTYCASCVLKLEPACGLEIESKKTRNIPFSMGIQYSPTLHGTTTTMTNSINMRDPHGKGVLRIRKKNGCIKTEYYNYWVTSQSTITCISTSGNVTSTQSQNKTPATTEGTANKRTTTDTLNARPTMLTVNAHISKNRGDVDSSLEKASLSSMTHQLAGGMKLELTEAEIAARREVLLPYEHQGEGALYATNDYRDYLPSDAGGKRDNAGRLGHILYVRDSDSDPDSDEDPDDDLDI